MSVLGKRGLDEIVDEDDSTADKRKKQKLSEHNETSLDDNHNTDNDGVIVLNVGGIKYQTTLQTLTGYQSMLKARFSSRYAIKPSADGSYFIDGDGKLFPLILKYLRTGSLLLPPTWKKTELWEFYIETKYFMIESLFNKILLKLFNSSIMTNDVLKLKVINKIGETLKWNKTQIMESLNEWRKIGSIPNKSGWGIANSLALIESENKIYGIFIKRYEEGNSGSWYFDMKNSFAFNCGANSCHLLSVYKDDDIKLEFKNVRKLTEDEKKIGSEDSVLEAQLYKWFFEFHPLSIRGKVKTRKKSIYTSMLGDSYTDWQVKFWEKDDDKYRDFGNSEIWSIPS